MQRTIPPITKLIHLSHKVIRSMPAADVVLLTDRRDNSRSLAEAVRTFAPCRVIGITQPLFCFDSVMGVIADIDLERPKTKSYLMSLADAPKKQRIPLIVLTRTSSSAVLREANGLGATACFSELTESRTIVAALFQQIKPGKTAIDLIVEYSTTRTGMLLTDMFAAARADRIDPERIEGGIDPVLTALREGGMKRWLDLVQAHDDMTVRHCLLVAGLVAHFALYLGLPEENRRALVRAGLVHDVGKACIPLAILNKPGPLDVDEMAVMRTHPEAGHAMLLAAGMDDPVTLAATRHHHEMLDGSGYPDGLCGDMIDDTVRLLTICDICAALVEHRPYRPPMPQAEALHILRKMASREVEPAFVEAFAASLKGVELMLPTEPRNVHSNKSRSPSE